MTVCGSARRSITHPLHGAGPSNLQRGARREHKGQSHEGRKRSGRTEGGVSLHRPSDVLYLLGRVNRQIRLIRIVNMYEMSSR